MLKQSHKYTIVAGALLLTVGIPMILIGLRGTLFAYSTRSWASSPGTITAFVADEPYVTKYGPVFNVRVDYTYLHNGRTCLGEGVYSDATRNISESLYTQLHHKYPVGKAITVYYDPDDTNQTVLERTYAPCGSASTFLMLGTVSIAFGAVLIIRNLWLLRRDESTVNIL